jgi:multisubunit Na+/H+ antiporter MnhB subunit
VSDAKPKGPRATPGPKPRRQKKLFERPWAWIVIAGLIVGAVFALGTSLLQSAHEAGGDPDDAFFAIAIVGVIAVVLMLLVGFYSARKRRRGLQEHMPGTMMVWLKGHVWIGLAAFVAILVHAWLYPITSSITTGKITLAILIVLVLSGIAWRIVYQTVPRRVPGSVGNLSVKDTRSRLEQIQVEIEKALAGASDELRALADQRLSGKGKVKPAELDRQAAALSLDEQATWEELQRLAERRDRYRGREPKQERYHRILQRWKVLHLPLAVILGAAIAIHVADVLGLKEKVSASEAHQFPDSVQCANCHTDIVDEWKLAMHAIAQTNPTVIAQTKLALQKYPDFEAVCTNCHAPIGNQIAHSDTFPLPGEDGGDAILGDGVTCWTCHALPNAPTEIEGAKDDFPVNRAGARSYGFVFAPPINGDFPLPVPNHQVDVGFMTDDIATYQLCGACHNVKVDLASPPDGFSVNGDDVTEGTNEDIDRNGVLDENDLQFVDLDGDGVADLTPGSPERDIDGTNRLLDLVLQTTFDEWEDYIQSDQFQPGDTCGRCHMPGLGQGPTVNDAPGNLSLPDRSRHSHEFVGVDYDLEPGHYEGLGVGDDARTEVLTARDRLISAAVTLTPEVEQVDARTLTVAVTVRTNDIGHDFPTGFAFARQWWLEASAQTQNGDPVCLSPVDPVTGLDDPRGIASPCSSGTLNTPQEDLRTCDPRQVAGTFGDELEAAGKPVNNANLVLTVSAPLTDCDPWLTNFQKILTDGDPEGTGQFLEVPFQSLLPDIVKLQTRVATQQLMTPLKAYDLPETEEDDREKTFVYIFDTTTAPGQKITVDVALHLRHLPPYFLTGLDGLYPDNLTGETLLKQMVVSTAAVEKITSKRVPQV